jgi:hypothetical protein
MVNAQVFGSNHQNAVLINGMTSAAVVEGLEALLLIVSVNAVLTYINEHLSSSVKLQSDTACVINDTGGSGAHAWSLCFFFQEV